MLECRPSLYIPPSHHESQMRYMLPALGLSLFTSITGVMIQQPEASACQPEPAKGYVVNTLPRDGGKTGISNESLDLVTPIALRWSGVKPSGVDQFFYVIGARGSELSVDEPVVYSFDVFEEGSDTPHPGKLVQENNEARFIPDMSLKPDTIYNVVVDFEDYQHTWSFETTSDPSFMDMPFPFGGITSTSLQEKAYPTYTYCDIDFDDPFSCFPERRQTGWDYRPALYISFEASDGPEHGPELFRYALHHHSSAQDMEGELVRYVDVTTAGAQTIEIERPDKVGDVYCYSLHYYYSYSQELELFGRSEIVCRQASDLTVAERLDPPDTTPLSCESGGSGGDMGGTTGGADMGGTTGGGTTGGDEGGGWTLNEQEHESLDDEGCGCSSSPSRAPDSGGLMLVAFGLCAGFVRRRRRA